MGAPVQAMELWDEKRVAPWPISRNLRKTLNKKKQLSMWDPQEKKEEELDAPEQQPTDKP